MLTLTYTGTTRVPLEAELIRPDLLAGKSHAEIAALPLQHGNAQAPLGEFFQIAGDPNDEQVTIVGDCQRVKWIGSGMTRGSILIDGPAGMHLGAEMVSGSIEVRGDVGDWLGAEMRGGVIRVQGNAGHLVGAAYRGSRRGMRGGTIVVAGKAGNEIGGTMRRGLIAIGGDTGDFVGAGMIAGTIFVMGKPGIRTAAGMKRGSVVLCHDEPAPLLPTFKASCTYQPTFLPLYFKRLQSLGLALRPEWQTSQYLRYCGDLVALGKGEVLQRVAGG
jgi:formylmethanofuran dehydrogenase subunit C